MPGATPQALESPSPLAGEGLGRGGRRQCLRVALAAVLALGLGAALPPLARAQSSQLPILRRWPTGDRQLVPTTRLGPQVIFAGENRLGLLDPAEDIITWHIAHQLPGPATFRPRSNGEIIVCGGLAEIAGWHPGEDRARWRYRARDQIGTPCLAQNRLFFGDGHELIAVDSEKGTILWRFATVPDTRISYAPVVVDDRVIFGPGDGRLIALSANDGTPHWIIDRMADWQYLRQLQLATLTDGSQILVAGSYKEKLHGIDLANGAQRWAFSAGNFINSQHVAKGVAYLWSPTGWVYAIDLESGRPRWRHQTTDYRGGVHNWGAMLAELLSDATRLYALDLNHVLHILSLDDGRALFDLKLPERVRPFVQLLDAGQVLLASETGDLLLGELPKNPAQTAIR